MSKKTTMYWVATALFCAAMTTSGVLNVSRAEFVREGLTAMGYPEYLMSILGVAKLLGVVAILLPGTGLLKEWAYAGFTFNLLGAAASHGFAGDPIGETLTPLVVLAVAATSYWSRPESRRIGSST